MRTGIQQRGGAVFDAARHYQELSFFQLHGVITELDPNFPLITRNISSSFSCCCHAD